MNAAARRAGITGSRWRQFRNGYRTENGVQIPVNVTDTNLARMANAVGATAEQLRDTGRFEAADILDRMLQDTISDDLSEQHGPGAPVPAQVLVRLSATQLQTAQLVLSHLEGLDNPAEASELIEAADQMISSLFTFGHLLTERRSGEVVQNYQTAVADIIDTRDRVRNRVEDQYRDAANYDSDESQSTLIESLTREEESLSRRHRPA